MSEVLKVLLLRGLVEVDPLRASGLPVLKGTRFTVSQLFAELGDGRGAPEVAAAFGLNKDAVESVLYAASDCFNFQFVG